MSDLVNLGAEAKVKYLDGDFIIEVPGTHVFCAVTGKPILMEMLRYWNVDLQEPYIDAAASLQAEQQRQLPDT
ncbi:MAG: DUF2093 domain-containing protein [Pseudomonadota bacterium]|jgi:hypothetical protein|nr:hypothetical protein [Hyphomicrobiales bacterium]MEC6998141.1 DUF2093 domain-containing protein [Pseudomonadota bacterium]MEC7177389.1 DUF2093 domain-containing protein [Pseudomonadota bacterium]MEC7184406.1 DUF2093 domain-containing protein [Pseudomonadota bacterium]MEC7475882.1 DUF2093 domain-containing protein [Pseudomonadota bacterium]|tara:strand:+ start:344 stop:562 length:219 start_codon:yes stop_codon:yes gene_type:complete